MFTIAFRPQGYTDTNTKAYNTTNTDTQLQKVCDCNLKSTHHITWIPYKTTKNAYSNLSQKQKYAAFVRRTQDTTVSNLDALNFQFRNL